MLQPAAATSKWRQQKVHQVCDNVMDPLFLTENCKLVRGDLLC